MQIQAQKQSFFPTESTSAHNYVSSFRMVWGVTEISASLPKCLHDQT